MTPYHFASGCQVFASLNANFATQNCTLNFLVGFNSLLLFGQYLSVTSDGITALPVYCEYSFILFFFLLP